MSSEFVQTLIIAAALLGAGIYLTRLGLRTLRGKSTCCGTSCSKTKATPKKVNRDASL